MIGEQQVAIADDRGQDIIEIMRHSAGKLSDRLHFLGLREVALQSPLFGGVERVNRRAVPVVFVRCREKQPCRPLAFPSQGGIDRRDIGSRLEGRGNGGIELTLVEDGAGASAGPKPEHGAADAPESLPVEAKLAGDLARDLGHPDTDVDLDRGEQVKVVDHLVLIAGEGARHGFGALRIGRVRHRASQHQGIRAGRADPHAPHAAQAAPYGALDRGRARFAVGPPGSLRRGGRRRCEPPDAGPDRDVVLRNRRAVLGRCDHRRAACGNSHDEQRCRRSRLHPRDTRVGRQDRHRRSRQLEQAPGSCLNHHEDRSWRRAGRRGSWRASPSRQRGGWSNTRRRSGHRVECLSPGAPAAR